MDELLVALQQLKKVDTGGSRPKSGGQKAKKKKSKGGNAAAGHGVGFGGSEGDRLNAAVMAQKEKLEKSSDMSMQAVFEQLSNALSRCEGNEVKIALEYDDNFLDVVESLLQNDSMLDIGRRGAVYKSLLRLLCSISQEPFAASLLLQPLGDGSDTSRTPLRLLSTLASQASVFVKLQQSAGDEDIEDALTIALQIDATNDECSRRVHQAQAMGLIPSSSATTSTQPSQGKSDTTSGTTWQAEEAKEYIRRLAPLRFESIPLVENITSGLSSHVLLNSSCSSQNTERYIKATSGHAGVTNPRARLSRIASEISTLLTSLPVEHGSSVFLRVDEDRPDVMKALIIGPEGTPYANGCFEFDILLPPTYPQNPPSVRIVTTGGGSVRFNPNLYNCGKVCLSLLGTWSGPGWDPAHSTLLQVLVSIQSLILVPDPFFNEPGYGNDVTRHKRASDQYNENIRYETLRVAIHDQMVRPPHTFADVIHKHFTLKRRTILQQLEEWNCKYSRTAHYVNEIRKLLDTKFSTPLPDQPATSNKQHCPPSSTTGNNEFEDYSHLLYDDTNAATTSTTGAKRNIDIDEFEDYSHLLYSDNEPSVEATVTSSVPPARAVKKPKLLPQESSASIMEIIDLT